MLNIVPHPLLFQSPCIWRGELLPAGLWGKGNDPSWLGTKTRGRKGLGNREEEASSQKEGWTVGLAGWEPQIFR